MDSFELYSQDQSLYEDDEFGYTKFDLFLVGILGFATAGALRAYINKKN